MECINGVAVTNKDGKWCIISLTVLWKPIMSEEMHERINDNNWEAITSKKNHNSREAITWKQDGRDAFFL